MRETLEDSHGDGDILARVEDGDEGEDDGGDD